MYSAWSLKSETKSDHDGAPTRRDSRGPSWALSTQRTPRRDSRTIPRLPSRARTRELAPRQSVPCSTCQHTWQIHVRREEKFGQKTFSTACGAPARAIPGDVPPNPCLARVPAHPRTRHAAHQPHPTCFHHTQPQIARRRGSADPQKTFYAAIDAPSRAVLGDVPPNPCLARVPAHPRARYAAHQPHPTCPPPLHSLHPSTPSTASLHSPLTSPPVGGPRVRAL